jgi:hypothetical protein
MGIVRFISGLTRQEKTHLQHKNTEMNERWQIYESVAFEHEDSDAVRPSMQMPSAKLSQEKIVLCRDSKGPYLPTIKKSLLQSLLLVGPDLLS